jgi:hypothetical protein
MATPSTKAILAVARPLVNELRVAGIRIVAAADPHRVLTVEMPAHEHVHPV